ncbi:MAG: YfcE family phosphodiesterase [bacterium]
MKIGVLSDSHKNLLYLRKALELLLKENVSFLIHLGDDYSDTKILDEYPIANIKVPGVFDPEYKDSNIKNRRIEEIAGFYFLISHTKTSHKNDQSTDLIPEDIISNGGIDIVLFGHTHLYEIKKENEIIFFNPGHLQEIDAKGRSATYGICEINDEIIFSIHSLDGNCLLKEAFPKCKRG